MEKKKSPCPSAFAFSLRRHTLTLEIDARFIHSAIRRLSRASPFAL
jgi:hypothetical protein